MFEFLIQSIDILLPIFIFATMGNVGMTQDPGQIAGDWKDWGFFAKMLAVNFIAAPVLMALLLVAWPMSDTFKAALFVYSICAGAPFLIKLTEAARRDIALAAASMMALVLGTVLFVPVALPVLLPEASVAGGSMARQLTLQLIFPMIVGLLIAHFLPKFNKIIQPWVARIGTVSLYALLIATIGGYLPDIPSIMGQGALVAGLIFVLICFAIGYWAGGGRGNQGEVGGLACAQRNTAAAMLIAASSFKDPLVFVLIAMVNTLGIIALLVMARELRRKRVKTQTA